MRFFCLQTGGARIVDALNVRFWGTRGSIPVPGHQTLEFGGNTPCVSLTTRHGDLVILDCGSGLRELGRWLLSRKVPVQGSIFVSHVHWDHIQGFPFFGPAFVPGNSFRLFGPEDSGQRLEVVLAGQMEFEYFPITLKDMQASVQFEELDAGAHQIGQVRIRTLPLNHTRPCLGYRLESAGRVVVYLSDVEPWEAPPADNLYRFDHPGDLALVEFARDADLLIQDGQYTMEEYRRARGFGHSPVDFAVQVACRARAARLAVFHHDPTHSDEFLHAMMDQARALACTLGSAVEVSGAAEGFEVEL